jgi:3-oxoadipate enol-lactonase
MTEELFVETRGSGIPLTLLHGYPLNHTIWLDVAARLEDQAKVIMPDLRGQGRSPAPAGTYFMDSLADDVVQVLDNLGIEKTIIGGHSMGGYVALAMAKNHPERLSGLVLIASHAFADSPEKRQSRLDSIEKIKAQGIGPILSSMPEKLSADPEIIAKCQKIILNASLQGVTSTLAGLAEREDAMSVFINLNIPAMIISGMDDQINPLSINREMAAKMKKPLIVEIEGAGHMPMLEQPEQVANALKLFIGLVKENS